MIVLLAAMSVFLAAADAGQLLDQGINAYEAMELELAADKLAAARAEASADERPRIDLWLGVVELERGRDAAARRHFKTALQANPRLSVPKSLSPKVHELVEELRPSLAPRTKARGAPRAAAVVRTPTPPALAPPAPTAPSPAPASAAPASPVVASAAPAPSGSGAAPAPAVPAPATPAAAQGPAEQGAQPAAAQPAAGQSPAEQSAAVAVDSGASVSPFLVLAAGGTALATAGVAGAVALGVSAKLLEAEAVEAPRAAEATERYEEASSNALIANALYVGSGVAAAAGAVGLGLWLAEGGVE